MSAFGPTSIRSLLLFSAACLPLVLGRTPAAATAPPGPSAARTMAVGQAFIDAYNRHDASAIMALFTPGGLYFDCDYARGLAGVLAAHPRHPVAGTGNLRQWLEARWEEGDRFSEATIGANQTIANDGGISATRNSDVLTELGQPGHPVAAKMILDRQSGTHIHSLVWNSFIECATGAFNGRMPLGLTSQQLEQHTKALVRGFLDAYNAADLNRVLQFFPKYPIYSDCDYANRRHVSLDTRQKLRRWFQARFREHDRFSDAQIFADNAAQPNVAGVSATRASDAITARGFSSLPAGFKIVLAEPHFTTMRGAVTPYPGDRCTS